MSAGALIAPYAFLGPSYDRQLAELWTTFDASAVATPQVLAGLLGAEAIADSTPLRNLIARHVDRRMLSRIAHEYRNGRVLMIGTTNLDAQRQVIWNMGEIAVAATRGDQEAVELFRDVLLASASLPGIFPPVHVKVRVGDQVYEEMHVDGGPTRQVFLAPAQFSLRTFDKLYPQPPIRRVYVVRNGKLAPIYEAVKPNTFAISARSLFTVTKNQSIGDINQIYAMTQRDGAEFRLASIPATFTRERAAVRPGLHEGAVQGGLQAGPQGNRLGAHTARRRDHRAAVRRPAQTKKGRLRGPSCSPTFLRLTRPLMPPACLRSPLPARREARCRSSGPGRRSSPCARPAPGIPG